MPKTKHKKKHNRRRVVTQRYRKKQKGGTPDPEQELGLMYRRLRDTDPDPRNYWIPEKQAIYKIKAAEKYCQQVPLDQCEMTQTKRGFPCSVENPSFFRKPSCTFSLRKALQKLNPDWGDYQDVNTDVTWHETGQDLFDRRQKEKVESYP